ncbi:subtilisin [Fusarium napiforme]|uniref:Subtilisin n=1 Tax=Fusarium napiforme TaxID=42672 RepID=A0A8H5J6Y7_9HYPO|nr:subtilisin [Fusarium napiforme]
MSSNRTKFLSELYLFVTGLIWGEVSSTDPFEPELIANDEQDDKDFLQFESAMAVISRAYDKNGDTSDNILKGGNSDLKLGNALQEQLTTFGNRLPDLDNIGHNASSSSSSKYGPSIVKIHQYRESILVTGTCNGQIQQHLLPSSTAQLKDIVAGLTKVNNLAEEEAFTKDVENLGESKPSKVPMNRECMDLPSESLFEHLIKGICQNKDHKALLKLSGWNEIHEKSVFHMILPCCRTADGHERPQCYVSCTLQSSQDTEHSAEHLRICEETEEARSWNIPLWLSFNDANIWLANTKGLKTHSSATTHNRRQITLEQLIQQRGMKTSDIHMVLKKFHLAYRLVSSVHHLYLGPWIQQDLTPKTIFFMHDAQTDVGEVLTAPYIDCLLQSVLRDTNDAVKDFSCEMQGPSRFFLSLAQVLIDIFKGETGHFDYGDDLRAWYDTLSEEAEAILKDDLAQHYRTAVYSCLLFFRHYRVEMRKAKENEARARLVILEHIISPLKENLDIWEEQVLQLSRVFRSSTGTGLMQGAHGVTNDQPGLATFTLFSDEDNRNEVLSNVSQVQSEHDFSPLMQRFLQRHILRGAGIENATDYLSARVKVAVIDTGLTCADDDHVLFAARGRIHRGRSFVGEETDWSDIHGHGTHVTKLLLRHAPECEVFIAKISNTRAFSESRVGQLAEALEWAGEQADIINLSFGLGQLCPSIRLKEVIDNLVRRRKLVFAAASNSGGNGSRPWPGNHPGVFCIHATNQRGTTNPDMNPTAMYTKDNFATLGEDIESYWMGKERCISGTSFATPIAAALAANILEFARRNLGFEEGNALQAYGPMRRLFRNKMTDNGEANGVYHYIKPWGDRLWGEQASNEDVARNLRDFLILGD